MVVNVQTRSIRRLREGRGDEERIEVVAAISFVGRQTAWPAGSLGLRTVSEIQLTGKLRTRGVYGSVSSPSILGNSILLVPTFVGTTGTRLASLAVIGSHAPTGTTFATITAYGH